MTITESRISNGIRVISQSMPNFSSVSLGIWAEVGSRNELESEQGIALSKEMLVNELVYADDTLILDVDEHAVQSFMYCIGLSR